MMNRMRNSAAVLTALVVLFTAATLSAQGGKTESAKTNSVAIYEAAPVQIDLLPGEALANILSGIKSDNLGLRKSSIYFAGKYRIKETVNALLEQLEKEEDPSTKILTALALYKIGAPEGIEAVKNLAANADAGKVKRMANAIYNVYLDENGEMIATSN